MIGQARDIYEAYTGENIMTGEVLSNFDRSIKFLSFGVVSFGKLSPRAAVTKAIEEIKKFGRNVSSRSVSEAMSMAEILEKYGASTPDAIEKMRKAANGIRVGKKGTSDFTVGTATREEMDLLGRAWVGPDATKLLEPKDWKKPFGEKVTIFYSRDGLRQYRPPEFKLKYRRVRANLEMRTEPHGDFLSNAHFDITN